LPKIASQTKMAWRDIGESIRPIEPRREVAAAAMRRSVGPIPSVEGDSTLTTGNPAFSNQMFAGYEQVYGASRSTAMTVEGTALKSLVLLAILMGGAFWSWSQMGQGALTQGLLLGALVGGGILALVTIIKPTLAPWTAPIYAAFEGIFLGALSRIIDIRFPGIAIQAVALSGGTLLGMLVIYSTGLIRVTQRLAAGIVAATGAIALVYLVALVLRMFGREFPLINSAGPFGIAFSLFVVGLAAFNLLLDFDLIEKAARSQAPKSMEWYGAFGLMVTLIWLYIEILNLLMKLQSRRD
jgi:uncharacterized YccA/Bax inhibitor family protein